MRIDFCIGSLRKWNHMNVADIIARTWSMSFTLQLDMEDAAFLAGIHAWLSINSDPTLDEDQLRDIYRIVSEVAHGDSATVMQRATGAIARLREQRLMVRTDTAGIVRGGDYSLSRMGNAIAEWFGEQEGLTRQSLEVMMTRIRADLGQIKLAAQEGGSREHWETCVSGPLRLTVMGLIEAIDRRQQGMDIQQEEIRERIGLMLEETWFEAIRSCDELLESTSGALQELHRALMHEIEGMFTLLNEIEELCEDAAQSEAVEAATHVRRQMERISVWGENRFTAWSEYYQNVHEFIRSVVSVDPDRAIRTRLRDGLKEYGKPAPWFLNVADQPPYRHLRDQSHEQSIQKIERMRSYTVAALDDPGPEAPLLERLERGLIVKSGQQEQMNLLEILMELLPDHHFDDIYVLAGDLVEWMTRRGAPQPLRETDWRQLGKGIEIQDLTIRRIGSRYGRESQHQDL
jgi:chromosome partition protein MukF